MAGSRGLLRHLSPIPEFIVLLFMSMASPALA